MRTPTLSQLRRVLGRALLAAPLVLACHAKEPPGTPRRPTPDAGIANTAPLDATATTGQCRHDPPDVTGCGGAEVVLRDSLESCGLPADGDIPEERCAEFCGDFDTRSCSVFSDPDGPPEVYCHAANPCMGRLPSDGALDGARYADAIVDHLALARRMEAISVAAFHELEADLARWGAPAPLLAACRDAARDEARHAAAMTRLLRSRGVTPEPIARPAAAGFASLHALALHNEREGAVGETWGALVARHQAEHAVDADVRAAMHAIADEETAHAALSFQISAWARTVLDADEVAALDAERATAFARLRATGGARPIAAAELGWPSPSATTAMLDVLAPLLA